MTLLFRINVISKKISSLCCLHAQTFDKKLVLAPFACHQRNLFTNSCSVYFSKKKVDEIKSPKCPDFEQFFTKTKKSETKQNGDVQLGKSSDDKRKPIIQPPIFDDKTKVKAPPRPIFEKTTSPIPPSGLRGVEDKPPTNIVIKNEQKAETLDDKTKQPDKPQASEKKYPLAKPLDEFRQFALMPLSWGSKKSTTVNSSPTQQKDTVSPGKSQTIENSKIKEKCTEASNLPTDGESNKSDRKYIWVAAAAALFGTVLVCTHAFQCGSQCLNLSLLIT